MSCTMLSFSRSLRICTINKLITYKVLNRSYCTNERPSDLSHNGSFLKEVRSIIYDIAEKTEKIPIVYDGNFIYERESSIYTQNPPTNYSKSICSFSYASKSQINHAIDHSLDNQVNWRSLAFEKRKSIFLNSADLFSAKYRSLLMASIMLGQGKNYYQADIDLCELIDFFRFNVYFAENILKSTNLISVEGIKNTLEYRPLEGFVAALCPFNFTAISGNLAATPALLGNVVLWKPSDNAMLSSWLVYKIMLEAGLPKNVIQFLPSNGSHFGEVITSSPHLSAINFTGSEKTFKKLWQTVGNNIDNYRTFPRMIGECGGKNFHLVHSSCDIDLAVNSTIRSAFEYAGQKCSACSRLYISSDIWPIFYEKLKKEHNNLKSQDLLDKDFFVSPVINKIAYDKVKYYIDYAKNNSSYKLLLGGSCDDRIGYFIEPTVFLCNDFNAKLLKEEIFGPVLTVYLYDDNNFDQILSQIDSASEYGLTAGIFSKKSEIIEKCLHKFYQTAGNIYINDKCTGAVVGQQPFGGARLSGTNDKAGMENYVLRFLSPRTLKTNKNYLYSWKYDYMQ